MSVRITYITQFHYLTFAAAIVVLLLGKCNIFHVQFIYYLVTRKGLLLGISFLN